MMTNNFSRAKKIVISSMLLALGVVVGRFNIHVPGFGRIVFNGPFYKFTAILFGPLYGSVTNFLTELLEILLNGKSGYFFLFLITASIRGLLIGLIWMLLNKKLRPGDKEKVDSRLIIVIALPDYVVSFLNTLILKYSLLWPRETFLARLCMRLAKDSVLIILNTFVLSIMLEVYKKIIDKS